MHRRSVLAAAGGLAAGLSAGCLGSLQGGNPGDGDALYPDERAVPDGAATHDLYVENYDEAAHRVELVVHRAGGEALLLEGTYDVPDRRAMKVPDLLVDGRSYEFALTVDGGGQHRFEHGVEPCPAGHEGGSRNAGLRVEDAAVDLREDACDALKVGTLPSAPHDRFFADGTDWS